MSELMELLNVHNQKILNRNNCRLFRRLICGNWVGGLEIINYLQGGVNAFKNRRRCKERIQ